jgi:hypothetical protein
MPLLMIAFKSNPEFAPKKKKDKKNHHWWIDQTSWSGALSIASKKSRNSWKK